MRMTITNRMMIGASLLMMTFSFAINANAQTCTQVPTCAELGYTKTSCSGDSLKCPFDQTKLFCAGDDGPCKVGDIYYTDGSCSATAVSGKEAVGVVAGGRVIVETLQRGAMTWDQAVATCKGVEIGGKTAHLPTRDEWLKIANNSVAINSGLSGIHAAELLKSEHWTSTEHPEITSNAMYVKPMGGSGSYSGYYLKSGNYYVRCVFNY